jgi:signal transduction histidine kinase
MAAPRRSSSVEFFHVASEALGDPDEAIVRVTRRPVVWASLYGSWIAVLGCFVAGGYPVARTIALAGVIAAVVPLVVLAATRPGGSAAPAIAVALPWAAGAQAVLMAAITGGLHSPFELVVLLTFSSMYARWASSRLGYLVLAVFGGSILCMAVVPRSWTGPALLDPWFTVAAVVAAMGAALAQAQYVAALRRTAATAIQETLRARDELAEHALARARELELVGSKLSHELKNPLTAIKTLVQVAHRTTRDPVVEKQLDVVEREIERMSVVLHGHLGFSRPLDRMEPQDVELVDLAESVLALFDGRARSAGVSLKRKGSARAMVDPKQLRGALLNLVANALEACSRGGRVEVALAEDDETVRVEVSDDGRGMSPEVVQRVGTPFFTTRERGTGLGVVLARAAFEQHGGTLEYRSVQGKGTTVIGTLPRAPARPPDADAAANDGVR